MKSVIVLVAVLLAHYGYVFVADEPKQASWYFYSDRGIEGVILCLLLLPMFQAMQGWRKMAGVFAVLLGAFEEGQTAICGYAGMGLNVPLNSSLCVERFGAIGYWIAIAFIFIILIRVKHERN